MKVVMGFDFSVVPHTADFKIHVYGKSLEELFCNALVGMFQSMQPKSSMCKLVGDRITCSSLPIERDIALESHDVNALLVDFLSESLALSDINNEAYLKSVIHSLQEKNGFYSLRATLYGISVQGFLGIDVKAVTFHQLDIKKIHETWQTYVVFDI